VRSWGSLALLLRSQTDWVNRASFPSNPSQEHPQRNIARDPYAFGHFYIHRSIAFSCNLKACPPLLPTAPTVAPEFSLLLHQLPTKPGTAKAQSIALALALQLRNNLRRSTRSRFRVSPSANPRHDQSLLPASQVASSNVHRFVSIASRVSQLSRQRSFESPSNTAGF
jgi:hypothetical protein